VCQLSLGGSCWVGLSLLCRGLCIVERCNSWREWDQGHLNRLLGRRAQRAVCSAESTAC
jgi:hypothetical protein